MYRNIRSLDICINEFDREKAFGIGCKVSAHDLTKQEISSRDLYKWLTIVRSAEFTFL